jgi:hypothetical protein
MNKVEPVTWRFRRHHIAAAWSGSKDGATWEIVR